MADPAQSSLTNMLSRFGVDYSNAPKPTPALLAFMRGLGMTMDTAEDSNRQNKLRMNERAVQARDEIGRQNERTVERMTGDLQSRGVLSSGETNTRVARQAENVAKATGDVEQTLAEGVERSEQAFAGTQDSLRQQALERTLGVETDQATREATSKAQETAYQRQQEASDLAYQRQSETQNTNWAKQESAADLAYQRQKEAQDAAYRAQEELFRKYGGLK